MFQKTCKISHDALYTRFHDKSPLTILSQVIQMQLEEDSKSFYSARAELSTNAFSSDDWPELSKNV